MPQSEIIVLERGHNVVELSNLEFNINQIKKNAEKRICQNKIGGGFISASLDSCDYLFIHKYGEDIRGFATVKKFIGDFGKEYLYIDLICNSVWGMETRSSEIRAGAKAIIDKVVEKGIELNVSYIKLNAIDSVISYYWRLGFRFPDVTRSDKAQQLVNELRTTQQVGNDDETERVMNQIILRYYPNHLSEKTQQLLATTTGTRIEYALDSGIPMIKYIERRGGRKYKRSGKKSKGRKYKRNGKKSKGRKYKRSGKKSKGRGKKTRNYKSIRK